MTMRGLIKLQHMYVQMRSECRIQCCNKQSSHGATKTSLLYSKFVPILHIGNNPRLRCNSVQYYMQNTERGFEYHVEMLT